MVGMTTDRLFETRLEIYYGDFAQEVSLLADQLFRILIFSEKLTFAGVSSKVENHAPNAYTLSLAHNIGFEEGRVISELLQEAIHRASVFS